VAIWLVPLLLECPLVQLLQTKTAHKVFWVKFSEHGGDTSARDRLMASCTEGAPEGVVVRLAVGSTLVFEEGAVVEGRVALLAHKAARVPLLVKTGNVVLGDCGGAPSTFWSKLVEVTRLAVC